MQKFANYKLHCLGYCPVYFKQLLLSKKQITLYRAINLHETPRTNICYLETASSTNEGTKSPPHLGHLGLRKSLVITSDPPLHPGASPLG